MSTARNIAIVLLLSGLTLACDRSPDLPARTSDRPKVVFIGIDGATWDVIDPMIEEGQLPNLAKLAERGTRRRLISLPPLSSPVVWTTMATGTFPRSHGILGFTFPFSRSRVARPVNSTMRHDPAIWNIATAYGKRTGQVGYFVSHPPEVIDGFMVTDLFDRRVKGSVYPASLSQHLEGSFSAKEDRRDHLGRFLPWDYDPAAAKDPESPEQLASMIVKGRVDQVVKRDEIYRRVALELAERPVDLFTSYFRIVDHSSHATWRFYDDSLFDEPASEFNKELLGDIIPEAYRYMDDVVGQLVESCGEDANYVIVSDHGFGPATVGYEVTENKGMVLSGSHRHDGIFLAAGPDIRKDAEAGLMTIMEVTPLLLALVGLPISDELPGRVPDELFREGFLEEHPVERVPAYEFDWRGESGGEGDTEVAGDDDEGMLDMLQSLGYIDDDIEAGEVPKLDGRDEVKFWDIEPNMRRHVLTGELTYDLLRDRGERAGKLFRQAEELDPEVAADLPRRVNGLIGIIEQELGLDVGSLVAADLIAQAGLEFDEGEPE